MFAAFDQDYKTLYYKIIKAASLSKIRVLSSAILSETYYRLFCFVIALKYLVSLNVIPIPVNIDIPFTNDILKRFVNTLELCYYSKFQSLMLSPVKCSDNIYMYI